jgi:hypothetical protein
MFYYFKVLIRLINGLHDYKVKKLTPNCCILWEINMIWLRRMEILKKLVKNMQNKKLNYIKHSIFKFQYIVMTLLIF